MVHASHEKACRWSRALALPLVVAAACGIVEAAGREMRRPASSSTRHIAPVEPVGCSTSTYLYVAAWSPSRLHRFCAGDNGRLYYKGEQPTAGDARDLEIAPSGPYLYYAHADLTRYGIADDGSLTALVTVPIGGGSLDDVVFGPLALDAQGTRLYVANNDGQDLSVFDIGPSGALTLQQVVATAGRPEDLVLHPNGRFLYVACRSGSGESSILSVFARTDDGRLAALPYLAKPLPDARRLAVVDLAD